MRIESHENDITIWGSFIGTVVSEEDQKNLIKWFMHNKPKLVKDCRKDLRTIKALKGSMKKEQAP